MSITLTFPVGYKPVLKHGEHDQSSHGNWALGNFDEETEYESAATIYSERYGVDNKGQVVGLSQQENLALDSYTSSGYKDINGYLRGTNKVTELDTQVAIQIVQESPSMYEEALDSYRENNEVGDELTESELDEAVYQYVTTNAKQILDDYNSGDTIIGANIRDKIDNLDSLIDDAPVLFGDKNLYRVFSDRVLEGLQEGDIMRDKGFLSTTRIDLTKEGQAESRTWMGGLSKTPDTVGVILPNESKSGKGLAVDMLGKAINDSGTIADTEKEILLPRDTPLKFLGYRTFVGNEARVAVFRRMDK